MSDTALLFYMKNIIYTIVKDKTSLIHPAIIVVPVRSNTSEQAGIFDASQHSYDQM